MTKVYTTDSIPRMDEKRTRHGEQDFESPYGQTLRAFREEAGVSQRQLALASGTNHTTISRIEGSISMPTLRTAVELAQALNLPPAERLLLYESAVLPSETPRKEMETGRVLEGIRNIQNPAQGL